MDPSLMHPCAKFRHLLKDSWICHFLIELVDVVTRC